MANVKIAMEYAAAIDRAAREERMSKMTAVECGYDRTASLSAGRYVCTCAAGRVLHEKTCATRHYTTQEQPK